MLSIHNGLNDEIRELREPSTSAQAFRCVISKMSQSLVEHVAQSAAHQKIEMRPTFVVIMRSGVSMLDGALTACPDAPVGHIGLHRDPRTFIAMEYYCKLPHIQGRDCIVLDPQMATGHTAVAAADRLVPMQPRSVTFVAALTTPVAIDYLATYHPGVAVLAASLEDGVDEHGEVVPGFGDVGQRLYGTA